MIHREWRHAEVYVRQEQRGNAWHRLLYLRCFSSYYAGLSSERIIHFPLHHETALKETMYAVGDYIILDTQDHMTIFLPRTKDTDDKKSMILSNDAADMFRAAIAFDGEKAPNDELVPLVERLLQEGSKDG